MASFLWNDKNNNSRNQKERCCMTSYSRIFLFFPFFCTFKGRRQNVDSTDELKSVKKILHIVILTFAAALFFWMLKVCLLGLLYSWWKPLSARLVLSHTLLMFLQASRVMIFFYFIFFYISPLSRKWTKIILPGPGLNHITFSSKDSTTDDSLHLFCICLQACLFFFFSMRPENMFLLVVFINFVHDIVQHLAFFVLHLLKKGLCQC